MGILSGFCSFVSEAGSVIASAAKTVFEKGKEVAAKVLNFMADEGEEMVQKVKDVWKKAKPYLEKIQVVAKIVKKTGAHPWILTAAEAIDAGLTALFALENSPVLKLVAAGIEWAIAAARILRDKWLNEAEVADAEARKQTFAQAADSLNDEQRRAVLFAQIVNELLLVRTKLQAQIDGPGATSFEHYLRLRATQKLLIDVNQRINGVAELDTITEDDLFLLEVGQELLATTPTLTDGQLMRLKVLVRQRCRKELEPFVFEELVRGWAMVLNADQERYENERDQLSYDEAIKKRLESHLGLDLPLSAAEQNQLAELQQSLPVRNDAAKALFTTIKHRQHFIDSAEGLLQALEGKIDEEVAALIPEVGTIIISCMEKGQRWEQLVEEERELVIDFANIFRADRIRRGKELEEETQGLTLVEVAA